MADEKIGIRIQIDKTLHAHLAATMQAIADDSGDDVFSKVTVVRFKNMPVPITDGSLWPH